jgi:hypothetical protein
MVTRRPPSARKPQAREQTETGAHSFFNALQDRGYEPILQGESGSRGRVSSSPTRGHRASSR